MKPILFNTDMVCAILDGRKSVTRRVVKHGGRTPLSFRRPKLYTMVEELNGQPYFGAGFYRDTDVFFVDGKQHIDAIYFQAPYRPGDILYVRETWNRNPFNYDEFIYKADGCYGPDMPWRPSIHMPKEAARIFLRVTDVRVERLQEPFFAQGSTIFALQEEGVDIGDHCQQCIDSYGYPCCNDLDPDMAYDEETGEDEAGGSECGMLDSVRYKFARLWDSTIKKTDLPRYGWNANPWVWVIEFERISKEEARKGGEGK